MDFIWIFVAFACGLAVRFINLPPLIGYLGAGFALNAWGVEQSDSMQVLADIGITLMLFSIGIKLKISDLLKPEVWAGCLSHMGVWLIVCVSTFALIAIIGIAQFSGLSWQTSSIIAFALSFSSTVAVIKMLEESGEMRSRHGKLAVGILVVQDIVAVLYLVAATGKMPEYWAIGLVALIWSTPLLNKLLNKAGHGEMLPLTGFFLAFGAYNLFEFCGVKGDLGALFVGALLANTQKAKELSDSLLNFKDLFLIGFFFSIGFTALPTLEMVYVALGISVLLIIKMLLFFTILCWFGLRARSAYLTALLLGNFSEFGLIVASLAQKQEMLSNEWLVIIALAVSFSFIYTSLAYRHAHKIYIYIGRFLHRFERPKPLSEDVQFQPKNAEILVIGLGRVGRGAYRALYEQLGNKVWGMDTDRAHIDDLTSKNYHVFYGDGEDADLWQNMDIRSVKLILLALPTIEDAKNVVVQLNEVNYQGKTAAIARFEDERIALTEMGIDRVFNFFNRAGRAFALESLELIDMPEHELEH